MKRAGRFTQWMLMVGLPLVLACGGGSDKATPTPPAAPQIQAPAQVSTGHAGTATVQSPQASLTYTWTVSGGSFSGGALTTTGSSATFTAGTPGNLVLHCTARDSAGLTSSETTATVTVVALPVISAFTAIPAAIIVAGQHSFLSASFSNGTGRVNPGNLAITSGTPLDIGIPAANITYTLVVTNAANDTVQQTVGITVAGSTPAFLATGSLSSGRDHQATKLFDGRILITGGVTSASTMAEIYDPGTGVFTPAGNLLKARVDHTATLLPNGTVFIAGGDETGPTTATQSTTEIFNPFTGISIAGPNLSTVRFRHSATQLDHGRVLIAGGQRWLSTNPSYDFVDTAEVYEPADGTLRTTNSNLLRPRASHTATLLDDNSVLITGGVNDGGRLDTAERFITWTGLFTATTGTMVLDRVDHSATLLADGRVLIVGDNMVRTAQAELYDPSTGLFTPTGSLAQFRSAHRAVRLKQGKVLIVGGARNDTHAPILVAELYDPATGLFTPTASLLEARERFSATLLDTGMVLIAGGWTQTAEVYSPAEPLP